MNKCSTYFTDHGSATNDEMEQDIEIVEKYSHHLLKDRKRS